MELFKNFMRQHTDLTDNDIEQLCDLAQVKTLHRHEYLLREGEVCTHIAFVLAGLLRTFVIAVDGSGHTMHFSPASSWVTDPESYDLQIPSSSNICAVEPATVLLWSKADFENFEATTFITTPEQRYKAFVNKNPVLEMRLPARIIAAHLGISLRTLDRIRQDQ